MTIELRHKETGHAQTFLDRQHAANFLATVDREGYEGWQHLGELPEPESDGEPATAAQATEATEERVATPKRASVARKAAATPAKKVAAKKGGKR
jgi:hypothetical protein